MLLTAAIDAYGKFWAISVGSTRTSTLQDGFSFFEFGLHKNPGIAFDIPIPFIVIFPLTVLICGFFAHFAYLSLTRSPEASLGATAVVIGALGNFIDRLINGFTTDYLIFFSTSAINLSDVLIIVGMVTFLCYYQSSPSVRTE